MTSRQVPTRARTWFRLTGWIALLLVCQQPVQGLAQAVSPDYRLRPGDEILISVPSRPELDRRLSLDATGRATIPQVGEVSLGGLTLEEAAEVLRQRLRLFYPAIDEVEVMPFTTAQIRIYVIGAVADSGQYQFTVLPTIWELLRAAGGPADEADLRHARVVRIAHTLAPQRLVDRHLLALLLKLLLRQRLGIAVLGLAGLAQVDLDEPRP